MSAFRRIVARLNQTVAGRGAGGREAAREIDAHAALIEDDLRAQGIDGREARRRARLAIGGLTQTRERHRDARMFTLVDDLQRDVRYALRALARTPGFTAVAVLTLALGIGANTAIFSVVNAVMLEPPPYAHPEQLVRLYEHVPATETRDGHPRRFSGINADELAAVREHATSLTKIAAGSSGFALVSIAGVNDGAQRELTLVATDLFPMYGVPPVLGRWFTRDDERSGDNEVVILSYDEWQRDFGGSTDALGKTLTFNGNTFSAGVALGATYTVVGVMPRSFSLDDSSQLWAPAASSDHNRNQRLSVVARLAPGVSPERAAAEVGAIALGARTPSPPGGGQLGPQLPDAGHAASAPRFEFVPIQDEIGTSVRPALFVLLGAVGFVLLVACANVANLLLARTASRQRELAIRAAIGAGRGRLIRQLLTESGVISIIGGSAGVLLAVAGVRLFRNLATTLERIDLGSFGNSFPRVNALTVDAHALLFAVAVSLATGLLFGFAPALHAARLKRAEVLRVGDAAAAAGGRFNAEDVLVVAEIAIAMLLLVGAGLLIRSFEKLMRVDIGFDPANVLTFQVALPGRAQPSSSLRSATGSTDEKQFAEELVAELRSIPGVVSAGYANQVPLVALQNSTQLRRTPGRPAPGALPVGADTRLVSRDYPKAIGMRLVAGRLFNESDGAASTRVLLINRKLAARDFSDRDPVGTIVYVGPSTTPWDIVGVVDDVRQSKLEVEAQPQLFALLEQWTDPGMPVFPLGAYYAVRTTADPLLIGASVRQAVRAVNPRASLENVVTMDRIVENAVRQPRLYASLFGIFAAIGLLLAAAGIYGVMAYRVARRTREIGIRMALGATRGEVVALVLQQSAVLTVIGILAGIAGAAATTRYLQSLLFGLTPLDAPTFIAVGLLFVAVAMLASYLPARRATKVDPLIALRAE